MEEIEMKVTKLFGMFILVVCFFGISGIATADLNDL